MVYLISMYWPWMLAALVLGAIVGWMISGSPKGWSRWALGLFVAGLLVAFVKILPGSWGLWLETALLLFASYIVGSLLAFFVKAQTSAQTAMPAALVGTVTGAAGVAAASIVRPSGTLPGKKPASLSMPVGGKLDDLKLIKGVGPKNEGILHGLGVYSFAQIGGWSGDEEKWVGHHMAFPGRVEREHWVEQAKLLASGGETEFSNAVKAGTIKTDATADAPLGEAEIARLKQDVEAKAAAAKAAETIRIADSAKAAAAAEGARAAAAAKAAEAAKASATAKAVEDAKAAEAAKVAAAAKAVEAAKIAEAASAAAATKAADNTRISAAAAGHPGQQPAALAAAHNGAGDDLKLIKGIGPKNEAILHSLGIWHFSQIADWKAEEEQWVGHHMAFPGRVEREHWVEQARLLAAGVDTEHSSGIKSGAIQVDAGSDTALSPAESDELKATLPEAAAAVADEGKFEGKRPLGLAKPRGGKADDLKRIRGIGPQNEGRLHALGIWHFDQIANWSPPQVQWVGGYLAFPGRIDREEWIAQAKHLATGQDTEFSKRVDKGLVATSRDDGSKGQGNAAAKPKDVA